MYFLGDTHGVRGVIVVVLKHKLENQNIIHVGDFGLGFREITRDIMDLQELDGLLESTGNTLYVIRGNHDNPIFWDKSKGLWLPKFMNIHLVDDYNIINVERKKILCAGGAISIDRLVRAGESPASWWKDEQFVYDQSKLMFALHSVDKVDIVVTHSAPAFAFPQNDNVQIVNSYCDLEAKHGFDLRKSIRKERADLEEMWKQIKLVGHNPERWIYGHFHNTKKQTISGMEFKLLNINELYQVS